MIIAVVTLIFGAIIVDNIVSAHPIFAFKIFNPTLDLLLFAIVIVGGYFYVGGGK